jgi:hypothetical protein
MVQEDQKCVRFHIGIEVLHSYPDTIRLLIKHHYSRWEEVPVR